MMIALAQADAVRIPLRDESVHLVCCSPPYWSLRQYSGDQARVWGGSVGCRHVWNDEIVIDRRGTQLGKAVVVDARESTRGRFCQLCGAWCGALGLEPDPSLYVQHIVEIFREIRRVLRKDGTVWANWGDSYSQGGGKQVLQTKNASHGLEGMRARTPHLPSKQLLGIPWRCALALQADGWFLRSDIIWAKGLSFCPTYSGSSMPESVKDRPSTSHEHLFLLTKSRTYYYDQNATREMQTSNYPSSFEKRGTSWNRHDADFIRGAAQSTIKRDGIDRGHVSHPAGRNLRSVWAINPQSYKGAHFATYPVKLVEPCIRTSPTRCCPVCGAGWKRVTKPTLEYAKVKRAMLGKTHQDTALELERGKDQGWGQQKARVTAGYVTTGWHPSCTCQGEPQRGPVKCERCNGTGLKHTRERGGEHWRDGANARPQLAHAGDGSGEFAKMESTGEPCPHCLCPDCNGTGKETKYRPDRRSLAIGIEFSTNTGASGGLTNYVPEETGEPCPKCNGAGALGYTTGDIWPDDVEDWPTKPAIILDPFVGSGTSLLAARKLGRSAIGLDLSLSYLRDQARKRLSLSALDGWHSTDAKDGEGESLDDLPLFTGM